MYSNLNAEITRLNLNKQTIADTIGISYGTLLKKLKGDFSFTLDEAALIVEKFFPALSIDYLFKKVD